jgi:hypothetical protein
MFSTDIQQFLDRAGKLTFGILATNGEPPEMQVRVGGSGIFISPFLGITARHVSRDFYALDASGDPGFHDGMRQAAHAPALFQVLEPGNPASPKALWHGGRSWNFLHTDMCLFQVSAEDATSDLIQYTWPTRFYELALIPPPVGTIVHALGYPGAEVAVRGAALHIDAKIEFREGVVTDIYSPYRDRSMLNFPCFAIQIAAGGGFSGGPVFWRDKLCGIVSAALQTDSAPDDGEPPITYAASLWPLLTTNVDLGLGKSEVIVEYLDRGTLRSSDWPHLRGRVVRKNDERGEYLDLLS